MARRNLVIFALFLLIAAGVVASQFIFRWSQGTFLNPAPTLNISVVYSAELRSWLESATNTFNSRNEKVGDQPVHVSIQESDDGQALSSIAAGTITPTAWIPASSIWVNLLNTKWHGDPSHLSDLLFRSGEYGTRPLVLTPMVFVMPADRADTFTRGRNVDWKEIQAAITNTGGWKGLGGPEDWGRFKFSQPDPSHSNAGLLSAVLATYTYFTKTTGLTINDIDDENYRTWAEGLISGFVDSAPPTAAQQMDDLLRYGESRYDVVSVYESLVAQQIKNAPGRLGTSLKVFYPHLNIWSDYPFSILMSDNSTAEQKDAALLFMNYLYSPEAQQAALQVGFRPANPDVPLYSDDPNNPFNQYKDAGLQLKIPRTVIADVPQGDVLTRLMTVYKR